MTQPTLDLKKTYKSLYAPSSTQVDVIHVPPMAYLMIDGQGDPNTSPIYRQAVEALYTLAYAIRAICKAQGTVFTVMPLEGLWTLTTTLGQPLQLTSADKSGFLWTMMILQPNFVTPNMVADAHVQASKKGDMDTLKNVRFEHYEEGDAVQILHRGSYDTEGATVARLHQTIEQNGWRLGRRHHEIYLSDPRKVSADKLKTIVRQPFDR